MFVCISLLLIVAPCLEFHLNSTACVEIVLVYIFVIVSVTLRIHFGSLAHGVVVFSPPVGKRRCIVMHLFVCCFSINIVCNKLLNCTYNERLFFMLMLIESIRWITARQPSPVFSHSSAPSVYASGNTKACLAWKNPFCWQTYTSRQSIRQQTTYQHHPRRHTW